MSRRTLLGWALVTTLGCKAIAGIQDREFVLEERAAACEAYCGSVERQCRGDQQQYETAEECRALCDTLYDLDTLECRQEKLMPGETRCSDIGPTAKGAITHCNGPCDDYCEAAEEICGEARAGNTFETSRPPDDRERRIAQCKEQCPVLRDDDIDTYSVPLDDDDDNDTLSCRFAQLSAAAVNPDAHCFATTLYPFWFQDGNTGGAPSPCRPKGGERVCQDYCRVVNFACSEQTLERMEEGERVEKDYRMYESVEECELICKAFEPGTIEQAVSGTGDLNTASCRLVHAYNVLPMGPLHCAHAGPGGSNVCDNGNGECDGYCSIVMSACEGSFESPEACVQSCKAEFEGPTGVSTYQFIPHYTVSTAQERGGMHCRLLFATRALVASERGEGDLEQLCDAASDAATCEDQPLPPAEGEDP